jgi:hypothetical protein
VVVSINSGLTRCATFARGSHGSLTFASRTIGGVEGSTAHVVVQRIGGTSGDVSVAYETRSGSADRSDYVPVRGRLSWASGDASSRTVNVQLVADGEVESPQRFFVRLVDPTGGATLLSPSMASVWVSDAGAASELEFADRGYVVRSGVPRAMLVVHGRQRAGRRHGELPHGRGHRAAGHALRRYHLVT